MTSNLPGAYLYPTTAHRFFAEAINPRTGKAYAGKTRVAYEGTYRQLQERNPGKRIDQFAIADLVGFLTKDRRWAEQTILRNRNAIVTLFAWAQKRGLHPEGRLLGVELREEVHPQNRTHRKAHWATGDDVQRLLSSCDDDTAVGRRDRILFEVFLGSGLRLGEVSALTWANVDLRDGTLLVDHGKGDKTRTVPLLPSLIDALKAWKTEYAKGLGAVPFDQPLFPPLKPVSIDQVERDARGRIVMVTHNSELAWGKGLKPGGVRDAVTTRTTNAGLPFRCHDLRRSYAGLLQNSGMRIEDIAVQLGHESIETTKRYLKDNPARRVEALRNIGW